MPALVPGRPRGSPRIRLISSLAMLALMAGGTWFYSVRTTNELLKIGVQAHISCAAEGNYPQQTGLPEMETALGSHLGPMLKPLLDNAGTHPEAVAAHNCTAGGREYIHILLRQGRIPISVVLTRHSDQEVFPRALGGRMVQAEGIKLHEGNESGYSVDAFQSGAWLGYIVSALPSQLNRDLAIRLAPVIDRFTRT